MADPPARPGASDDHYEGSMITANSRKLNPRRRKGAVPVLTGGAVLVIALIAALIAGVQPMQSGDDSTPHETSGSASALLETLPVKGREPKTGYDRAVKFGQAWKDVDRNGCDTRNDILARDLVDITTAGTCKVLTGTLDDPYTGNTISFERGEQTSADVQIDHVVSLSNAWQTGAQQISQEQREALANDPSNLFAVDGPTNSQKGDGDAATWLPPQRGFWCEYVAHQIGIKADYDLWVTPAEKAAMVDVLARCPGQEVVTG